MFVVTDKLTSVALAKPKQTKFKMFGVKTLCLSQLDKALFFLGGGDTLVRVLALLVKFCYDNLALGLTTLVFNNDLV